MSLRNPQAATFCPTCESTLPPGTEIQYFTQNPLCPKQHDLDFGSEVFRMLDHMQALFDAISFRLYLLPAFGQKDLSAITREEVKTLAYGLLAQGKSRKYVVSVMAPLSEMFNHVVEDGHVAANPTVRLLRRTRAEEQKTTADFLSREELGLLLRTCQEHFPEHYPLISLLARTRGSGSAKR